VDFLAAGLPPVYIGFGSMTARDPRELTNIAVEALRAAGQRGVLLSGWAGLGTDSEVPDHVCVVTDVPHAWLFPRVAAVVHHGGAGTTAAGLRAGVPTIVTPVGGDQPFWGARVARLGAGPPPIPPRELTAARLAAAIRTATADVGMRRRAAALGERIRAEDGVGGAVAAFEQHITGARRVGGRAAASR
jgi:UDP:flavonoid glycosyltransferase YjiC (YdhE family)